MKQYIENLKHQAEENPLIAAGVLATVIVTVTKLMQANTERLNAKTWAREVDRRRLLAK